jgi:uncharacterized protein
MGPAEGTDERRHGVDSEGGEGDQVEVPAATPATAPTSATTVSTARNASRVAGTNAAPAAVSLTRRPSRSNRATPSSRSSAPTACESDGWATWHAAAAAVNVPLVDNRQGGSAVATPLLAAVGVPPIIAVASPLPATVPGTLIAYRRYRRLGIGDGRVIRTSIVVGVPATILGAAATRWISGDFLVTVTDAVLLAIGIKLALWPAPTEVVRDDVTHATARTIAVAATVGVLAGLLANAGGFLLVPLYLAVLKQPIKTALACSLAVASALALPGTIVHAALGHIDWTVTLVFGLASIPLSSYGARLALQMRADRLERMYGGGLAVLGFVLLAGSLI